jgi:N-acetylmuramoyl-L-alanine amidase
MEKDVNLDLALALQKELAEAGAEVVMIRTGDVNMELEARADLIRKKKPDLAISLHRNSMGAGSDISKYQGILALYSHNQSAILAEYIRNALVNGTTHHDSGARWQSLAVCRIEECPAVLIELGFISNPADYERMTRKSVVRKEAQAILRGVIAYMSDS